MADTFSQIYIQTIFAVQNRNALIQPTWCKPMTKLAALFGKARTTITKHIKKVFNEGELNEDLVCRNFRLTTQHGAIEGKTQEVS